MSKHEVPFWIVGLLALMGVLALCASQWVLASRVASLEARIVELEEQHRILAGGYSLLLLSRSEHASMLEDHEEYIRARRAGYASAPTIEEAVDE